MLPSQPNWAANEDRPFSGLDCLDRNSKGFTPIVSLCVWWFTPFKMAPTHPHNAIPRHTEEVGCKGGSTTHPQLTDHSVSCTLRVSCILGYTASIMIITACIRSAAIHLW